MDVSDRSFWGTRPGPPCCLRRRVSLGRPCAARPPRSGDRTRRPPSGACIPPSRRCTPWPRESRCAAAGRTRRRGEAGGRGAGDGRAERNGGSAREGQRCDPPAREGPSDAGPLPPHTARRAVRSPAGAAPGNRVPQAWPGGPGTSPVHCEGSTGPGRPPGGGASVPAVGGRRPSPAATAGCRRARRRGRFPAGRGPRPAARGHGTGDQPCGRGAAPCGPARRGPVERRMPGGNEGGDVTMARTAGGFLARPLTLRALRRSGFCG